MRAERVPSIVLDVLLLLGVVLPPSLALAALRLDPALPFSMVTWVTGAAVLVGLALAISDTPGELAHPLALLGGIGGVFIAVARALPDAPPTTSLDERLQAVLFQLYTWFVVVLAGNQATNNLLFLLLLAVVGWLVGYLGAWAVFRAGSAWWPVTASATAMTLVLANFPNLVGYMLVQLAASMLLVGRVNLEVRQATWQRLGLRQSSGLSGHAFRTSLAVALALIGLAWIAPTALASRPISESLGRTTRPWEQAQAAFNRLFGGLQAQNEAGLSGFSRAMTLHGSFHLADTPVLQISSPRPEYWRAIVYDRYTGHGWLSSDPVDQRTLPAGSDALRSAEPARIEIDQQVTVLAPRGNYLVGASEPFRFDRTVVAQAYPDAPGNRVDLVSSISAEPLQRGSHYVVASQVSTASTAALRTSTRAYPAEVRQRYLSLPPIPTRVRQLAAQLTAGQQNPYDKAVALESYLRAMPYTLDLPPPPSDRDAVDYFLFDARTGYCDYFASSMAVMARSIGLPARVVAGYATGERQDDGTYLVRDSNSHSWTEIYLPPYGWIPFEPSGAWPRFTRGSGAASAPTPTPVPTVQPMVNPAQGQSQVTPTPTPSPTPVAEVTPKPEVAPIQPRLDLRPLLPLLYLLALLLLAALILWSLWERGLRGLPPAAVAYGKMIRLAGWLGFGIRPSETPEEYSQALGATLPRVRSSVQQIAREYARYRFGPPTDAGSDHVLRLWRFVRNALLRRIGRLRRS